MSITVICTSYNRKDMTLDWLRMFERAWPQEETTLIVTDDCSTDGTKEAVEEYIESSRHDIRLVYKPTNTGFADTVLAAQRVRPKTDWVLVTQNDVEFAKGSVDALIKAFVKIEEKIVNLGVVGLSGGIIRDYKVAEDLCRWNGDGLVGYGWVNDFDYEIVDYVDGWLTLYRGDIAIKSGIGYDPRYRYYWEDVDLCWQYRRAGYCTAMVSMRGYKIPRIHHRRNQTIRVVRDDADKTMREMQEVFRKKWERK